MSLLHQRGFGRSPLDLTVLDLAWEEYMHFMYLPVLMPGAAGVRLPQRLEFLRPIVEIACDMEDIDRDDPSVYVYATARRGYATPGNPLNRPGWHADGFGTQDVNYIWTDRYPTLFAEQPFDAISEDHTVSMQQFAGQIDQARVVTYPDRTLLRLDPYVIHAAPAIPAPGGERGFIKISVSDAKYNLRGNSHNYLFDYEWRMWSRDEIRNDPAYAGSDAGPEVEL